MEAKQKSPIHIIILLVLAGESIFVLPFVIARVFRPTFLATFDLTNYEFGICLSAYGIVALFSYIFGGRLADNYAPNQLMAVALLLTALGGFFMAIFPTFSLMKYLYGYFGFTTICLFWSAMIKATRIWGGYSRQGRAFGFLDGGRGLVGAGFGLLGFVVFSFFLSREMPADIDMLSLGERKSAFRNVILVTSLFVAVIGVIVLFFMKQKSDKELIETNQSFSFKNILTVIKIKPIWWLMIIILCAYVGYKMTDDFSLYAREVMLYNEVESAKIGTLLLFTRPIVGIGIGFLADLTKPTLLMKTGFVITAIGALLMASGFLAPGLTVFFFVSIITVALGVYALRALYFAVLNQAKVPIALTGTAVGIVSFVGYMPDIFMGPAMGYLLDKSPGELGHQHVFLMCAIFATIGFFATVLFKKAST